MAEGATDAEVFKAKRDIRIAEREVVGLNNLLTEAYGLGPNRYWNNNNQANAQDNTEQGTAQPTNLSQVKNGQPKKVDQLKAWVNNPEGYRSPLITKPMEPETSTPVIPSTPDNDERMYDMIPSSMRTGISSNAIDGHKYAVLDDNEQQQGRAVERRYSEETQELCTNIEEYLLAQADPHKDINEFRGKYPYGTQQMQMWTDQLKRKMGEDAAGMFISRCMKEAEEQFGGADAEKESGDSHFLESIVDTGSSVGQDVAFEEALERAEKDEKKRILDAPLDELSLEETEIRLALDEEQIKNEVETWYEIEIALKTQKARKYFKDFYNGLSKNIKYQLEKQGISNVNEYIDNCFEVNHTEEIINNMVNQKREEKLRERFHEAYIDIMPADFVKLVQGISLPFRKVEFTNFAQMKVVADTLEYFSNYYSDVSEVTGAGSLTTAWYGPLSFSLGLVGFGLGRGSKNYKDAADELRRLMKEGKTATVRFGIGDMDVIGG